MKSKGLKVVYWNNIPSPYMVERFNALVDRGKFEFEAWFNDRSADDRSWNVDEAGWRFPYRYIPITRLWNLRLHWPLPVLGRRPDVLVSLYAEPSFLTGWIIAKLRNVKTGFWVEATSDRWIKRTLIKESLKKWLFPRVDAIVTVGDDGKHFAENYGARPGNIFFAPHTIDVLHYQKGANDALPNRDTLRAELGLKGTTFIYVGRLWWVKGINHLLSAFQAVQHQSEVEISLLIVGDGPEEVKLRHTCAELGIRNVVFAGFIQKPDMPSYYALADILVFPTLGDTYGLVVDEAMACGLPVISTSAVGEIADRIQEGVNGYIIPPENSEAMADKMLILIKNGKLRRKMGEASYEKIKNNTPEKWAADFERLVISITSEKG